MVIKRYEEGGEEDQVISGSLWDPDAPFELKLFKEKKGVSVYLLRC